MYEFKTHTYTGSEAADWLPYFADSEVGKEYNVMVRTEDNFLTMSDTELELRGIENGLAELRGDVLIVGLGMGLLNNKAADLPAVKSVTTLEKYQEVIDAVEANHKVITKLGRKKYDTIYVDIDEVTHYDYTKHLKVGGFVTGWKPKQI